jgi:hypothetical protein
LGGLQSDLIFLAGEVFVELNQLHVDIESFATALGRHGGGLCRVKI